MALPYVPYGDLAGRPNAIVDGSPAEGTVLTLSHWPGAASPPGTEADLSAQMAFRWLDSGAPTEAEAVSNNHFDQDGLVSVFALSQPDGAQDRRDLLIDLAAAGDFGTYRHRRAARASMAIAAFDAGGDDPYDHWLPLLPELLDHPGHFEDL